EYAFLDEPLAEWLRGRGMAQHAGRDGRLAPSDVEAERDEPLVEILRVRPQLLHVPRLRLEHVDRGRTGGRDRRRMRAAQEPGPRLVQRVVPEVVRSGDVAADHAERLRERAQLDLDLVFDVEMRRDAPAAVPQDSFPVRVVD